MGKMPTESLGKFSELKLHCFCLFDAYSMPKDMCSVCTFCIQKQPILWKLCEVFDLLGNLKLASKKMKIMSMHTTKAKYKVYKVFDSLMHVCQKSRSNEWYCDDWQATLLKLFSRLHSTFTN